MTDFFEKVNDKIKYSWIVYVALGVLMLFIPGITLKVASVAVGIVLLLRGISRMNENTGTGIFYIIFGILFILNTRILASIFPSLFGIMMIVNGYSNYLNAKKLRELNVRGAVFEYIIALITVIIGFIMLIRPFGMAKFTLRIVAVCLIYIGITDIIYNCSKHRLKVQISDADDDVTPVD